MRQREMTETEREAWLEQFREIHSELVETYFEEILPAYTEARDRKNAFHNTIQTLSLLIKCEGDMDKALEMFRDSGDDFVEAYKRARRSVEEDS